MKRRDALVSAATLAVTACAGAQLDRAPAAEGTAAPVPPAPAAASPVAGPPPTAPTPVDELKVLLQTQAKQWSAGDIEGFCSHYGEDCLFLAAGALTRGRKEVLARYKKRYVDKSTMGSLAREVLGAATADRVASIAKAYTRSKTARPPATGDSEIGRAKSGGLWKIVHDASV
jgi:hypothetical protein